MAGASTLDVPTGGGVETAISAAVVSRDRSGLDRLCELLAQADVEVTHRLRRPGAARMPTGARAPDAVVYVVDGASDTWDEAVEDIRRRLPQSGVVVVAPDATRYDVRAALDAGADGFVVAADVESTLAITVRSVCAGQVSVPQRGRVAVERRVLSYREKQVLGLVVLGFMNAEIGDRLCLAESTVKSHLSSAFSKLGVHSRNEAAALILDPKQGLAGGILGITADVPAERKAQG
jgi:DNA-binding NarL/FixJ family response regulator